jgi:hypothetical protein
VTTTHEIQSDIEAACDTIAKTWDHMWPPLSAGTVRRASASAGILAEGDDDDRAEHDIGLADRIVSARYETLEGLQFWAHAIVERFSVEATNFYVTDTGKLCEFVSKWAAHMSGQDDGEDCAAELGQFARTCHRIAYPSRRDWLPIGECPNTIGVEGVPVVCGTTVRVYPDKPGDIRCLGCGKSETFDGWILLMCGNEGLLTPEQLVGKLHQAGYAATVPQVWQWRKRGVIAPSGKDEQGRPLYDRIAVLAALRKRTG